MTKKHVWLMLAFCLIPVAILAAIVIFNVTLGPALLFGLILLCPLAHLLMMKFMGHNHQAPIKPILKDEKAGERYVRNHQ